MQIGVISDTHGLVRPEAISALTGSDLILHAGDIGSDAVLGALRRVAPVHAVRGNTDSGPWADALPAAEVVEAGSHLLHLLHEIAQLDLDPATAGFSAVVFGHSHRPLVERRNGVLFLNPGSAGPRSLALPISLAMIQVCGAQLTVDLITLDA
jgi:putative phosphoesterase